MKNIKMIYLVLLLFCLGMGIPSATFSEEVAPDNIKTVYLKSGGSLRCNMAWVDGDVMHIKMRSGMMQFSLETVDIKKTYKEAERLNKRLAEER